jgi:hypothetical protein
MAELDPIVQDILLQGDEELITALKKIGTDGQESIEKLTKAMDAGASAGELFGSAILGIGKAISTATSALIGFAEAQNEITQKTAYLADALGTNVQNLQSIEAAFASAGVSSQTFERFANRLTITIAQQWPQITASIRTSATEAEAAQEKYISATLRVREAQNNLQNNGDETASRLAAANSRVESTFRALQFAGERAAQDLRKDFDNIAGAQLSVVSAQQALDTLLGKPPSDSEKQSLAISQAQLNLDKARTAQTDARIAAQERQAAAAQKQRDLEQAASDAQFKRDKELEEANIRQIQLTNALREARTQLDADSEKNTKRQLTDINAITTSLQGIIKSGKDAALAVDITQVSVKNLEQGVINLASVGGQKPEGIATLLALSDLLNKSTEEQISKATRLALVQKLAATQLANTGASTSELLKALEHGPAFFDKFNAAAEAGFQITEHGVHDIEHFREAITLLEQQLSLVQQSFAAAISPVLTEFLTALADSIRKNDGLIHQFIDGIVALGHALASIGSFVTDLFGKLDTLFGLEKGAAFKSLLITIGIVLASFLPLIVVIPAAIALVVTAVGAVADKWDEVKKAAASAWEVVTDNAVTRFFERLVSVFERLSKLWDTFKGAFSNPNTPPVDTGGGAASADTGSNEPLVGYAGGGEVHGPGTTTSDSVFARLSRGEFVMKAQAVSTYGADMFHRLNNMSFPGFASGGLVAPPVRLAGGGSIPASSVLNLTIGDRQFSGLSGPKSVVDDLSSYAIGRQTNAAGRNPSWMK